jgi:hypothetical protein
MQVSKEKADLNERFRDNPETIAPYLNEALAKNELAPVLKALNQILIGSSQFRGRRDPFLPDRN